MKKKAIVLVAGLGSRLMPRTKHTHKCLTKVNGTPILFNTLRNLAQISVSEVVLVVGYLEDTIREQIGSVFDGMSIKYVSNPIYDKTNTSYSLQRGLKEVNDYDVIYLLEGDVFFEPALLQHLDKDVHENITMVEPYNPKLDGTFVSLNDECFVSDWTHKSKRQENYTLEDKFKTINIHRFSGQFVQNVLSPIVDKICSEYGGQEPLESVMREIVRDDNYIIYALKAGGDRWFEIDDENDLAIAEEIFGE